MINKLALTLLIITAIIISFLSINVQAQVEDPPQLTSEGGAENIQSVNSVVINRKFDYGDNQIHGLIYYDGYLWASTRTSPARVLKIDPHTLDYQRITMSYGLNSGEDIEAAEGAIWVILYTNPSKLVKINPSDLSWQVVLTLNGLSYGGSLDYSNGYLWVGGRDRIVARINLSNLTYQTFYYPTAASGTQFHAISSGGNYLWAAAPTGNAATIVRINPNNPTDYSSLNISQPLPDDMVYREDYLFVAGEQSQSNIFRIANDLTYTTTLKSQNVAYGVFATPYTNTIYSAYVGSPGYVIEYDIDLNSYYTHTLPTGFNNANEVVTDTLGFIYVTAWQSPAGVVKFITLPSLLQTSYTGPYGYPPANNNYTISSHGCFMTSAAMITNYFSGKLNLDFRTDPSVFNDWLRTNEGYTPSSTVKWAKIIEYANQNSTPLAVIGSFQGQDNSTLDTALENGHLAILGVNNNGHYVVANGKATVDGQPTYTINDPLYGRTTLSQSWGNAYSSALILGTSQNRGLVGITIHSPAELLVTDPQGRRVGLDPITGVSYDEVPEASYFEDTLASNGGSGSDPNAIRTKSVIIPTPIDGGYVIQVIGTGSGAYSMIASATNSGGQVFEQSVEGLTQLGQTNVYEFTYNSSFRIYMPLIKR